MSLEGVPARSSSFFSGTKTFTAPVFRALRAALPPVIQVSKNAKRFRWALEMLGRGRNTVKIGISAVFGPKALGPPHAGPENGPPASFDDQPNGLRLAPRPDLGFPARHGPIVIIT